MSEHWPFITSVLQIVVIDVVLSGDNAVVIAMAAYRLPRRERRMAILFGALGAIVLRVLFTWVLAQLLVVPLLRFVGGLFLVGIALKLLLEDDQEKVHSMRTGGSLLQAVWIIMMADFVMSLDNMLAVGGASEGHAALILFGLLLSIAIIMSCSALIAKLMGRFPVVVLIGAGVLAWTAGQMIIDDEKIAQLLVTRTHYCLAHDWDKLLQRPEIFEAWFGEQTPQLVHQHWIGWGLMIGITLFVVASPYWSRAFRRARKPSTAENEPSSEPLPGNLPSPLDEA